MPKKYKKDDALKDMGAYKESEDHNKYKGKWTALAAIPAIVYLPFIVPLFVLFSMWGNGTGESISFMSRLHFVEQYFGAIGKVAQHQLNPGTFIKNYIGFWFKPKPGPNMTWNAYIPFPFFIAIPAPWVIYCITKIKANPYRSTPNVYGDARWANEEDIDDMGGNNLIGFEEKQYGSKNMQLFTIGRYTPKGSKKSMLIRMGETLSVLLLAPPGTGKTAGFIVPSTLTMDHVSLFLHDQKPELFDMTSGWRSTLGPVFQLKWSAQNAPEGEAITEEQKLRISPDLLLMKNGEYVKNEDGDYLTKPIFYPSWNPLSPKSMPGPGTKRDLYIDRLVNVLVPAPKGGGDTFWVDKGRTALLGLIHYLVAKVDYANHPQIEGDNKWEGIPKHWQNREASFPMLISWYAYIQQVDDENANEADPMRDVFKRCADDARAMDDIFEKVYGQRVMDRSINELTSLMNSPDKTRGSILQTMDASLNAFKSAAVSERTSVSDFAFNELRGMPIKEAKEREMKKVEENAKKGKIYKPRYKKEEYKPVTIYISIPAEDAKTFASLTGIFVDAANAYLVANGPNTIDDQGNQNGPYPFGFLLDEAPQLPKLDTVMNGPAVGRSKKVFYVIVGQDFGQFAEKYSKDEVGSLKSITAIKLMLSQNNEESARQVVNMVGKTTIVKHNYSPKGDGGGKSKGLGGAIEDTFKSFAPQKMSASESLEGVEFIKADQVMSMPKGKHIAIIQNYANRPLYLDTPFFFKPESGVADKVYNMETGKGLAPTTPMPQDDIDRALLEWKSQQSKKTENNNIEAKKKNPQITVVLSPEDILAFHQASGNTSFGIGDINLDKWYFFKTENDPRDQTMAQISSPQDILETTSPEEAAKLMGGGRTTMFDAATLTRLNAWLATQEQEPILKELTTFIDEKAKQNEYGVYETLCDIGLSESQRLNLPSHLSIENIIEWYIELDEQITLEAENQAVFDELF